LNVKILVVISSYLLILWKRFVKDIFISHIFLLYIVAVVDLTGMIKYLGVEGPRTNSVC
jgi:hypothetical protein